MLCLGMSPGMMSSRFLHSWIEHGSVTHSKSLQKSCICQELRATWHLATHLHHAGASHDAFAAWWTSRGQSLGNISLLHCEYRTIMEILDRRYKASENEAFATWVWLNSKRHSKIPNLLTTTVNNTEFGWLKFGGRTNLLGIVRNSML